MHLSILLAQFLLRLRLMRLKIKRKFLTCRLKPIHLSWLTVELLAYNKSNLSTNNYFLKQILFVMNNKYFIGCMQINDIIIGIFMKVINNFKFFYKLLLFRKIMCCFLCKVFYAEVIQIELVCQFWYTKFVAYK